MTKNLLTITIVLFSGIFIYAQNNILIENINIVPLHINQTLNNMDVYLENGEVVKITKHKKLVHSDSMQFTIDGTGKFLLPAYVDAHAHLPDSSFWETYKWMQILNGVTTFRSMRGQYLHLDLKEKLYREKIYPKLFLSSPPISRRDTLDNQGFDKLIKDYKDAGFDFIKILSVKDKASFDNIVESATRNNIDLAGHCPYNIGVFNVAQTGIYRSVEHLGGIIRLREVSDINKGIELCIQNNVYHCPTLDWYYTGQVLEDSLRHKRGIKYIRQLDIDKWENKIANYYSETTPEKRIEDRKKESNKFEFRLKYLSYMYRQGSNLLLSPDASGLYGIPGFDYHREMEHFAKVGISNIDILRASSLNYFKMTGQSNEYGTIKVGQKTDLLILSANPIDNISNSNGIDGVIINGYYLSKPEMVDKLNQSIANDKR